MLPLPTVGRTLVSRLVAISLYFCQFLTSVSAKTDRVCQDTLSTSTYFSCAFKMFIPVTRGFAALKLLAFGMLCLRRFVSLNWIDLSHSMKMLNNFI